MSSTFNCLPYASHLFPASRRGNSVPQSSGITAAPNLKWQPVKGPVQESLLQELQKMYWAGVKRELGHIILSLKKWQTPDYASVILSDEQDDFIHGFDTFVDQVSETSREFAERYEKRVSAWKTGERIPYHEALEEMAKDTDASWESESLKKDIRDYLESMLS